MLIIGSQALAHHFPQAGIVPRDTDVICTLEEFREYMKRFEKGDVILCKPLSASKIHVRTKDGWNYEFEIEQANTTSERLQDRYSVHGLYSGMTQYAPPEVLLMLKLSHRYLRNSPHFLKTMKTVQFLREQGVELDDWLKEVLVQREKETYVYNHPKLNVSKDAFFDGDGVDYIYDHDTIHLTQALIVIPVQVDNAPGGVENWHRPAYTHYMKDGSDVMTSKEKFMSVAENIRLYGVYEETCVLALERSQIPFNMMPTEEGASVWFDRDRSGPSPRKSFEYALMKVCTSITSGWFREYAWENYNKVIDLYNELGEDDYIKRFTANQHLLKPYQKPMMEGM